MQACPSSFRTLTHWLWWGLRVGARAHEPTIRALAALGHRCRLLGSVSDGVLRELYRRCDAFCYPSLGEGFGLPVLEAMAAGAR